MWLAACIAASLVLAFLAAAAWQIDDWSRDLWENRAATAENAADPALRPIRSNLPPAELASAVEQAVAELAGWRLESKSVAGSEIRLACVRTTRLWRFQDDVLIRIESAPQGSTLSAESRSRVGRGDLGQNPRNLRELLSAVRHILENVPPKE